MDRYILSDRDVSAGRGSSKPLGPVPMNRFNVVEYFEGHHLMKIAPFPAAWVNISWSRKGDRYEAYFRQVLGLQCPLDVLS